MMPEKARLSTPGLQPFHEFLQHKLDLKPPASKRDRTRARLRIAGAGELSKVPYHSLRLQDICDRAEVALGTFYLHFESKKELTIDVLSEFTHALWANLPPVTDVTGRYGRLLAVNLYYIESFKANSSLMRCLLQHDDETLEFAEIWRRSNKKWLKRAVKILLQRPSGLALTDDSAHFIGHALGGMVDSLLLNAYVRRDPALTRLAHSPRRIADVVTSIWYKAAYADSLPPIDTRDDAPPVVAALAKKTKERQSRV